MRTPRLSLAVLIAIGLFGCDGSYPSPIGFEDLDGGIGGRGAEAGSSSRGSGGTGGGQGGQAGQSAGPLGAAGTDGVVPPSAAASPFTCPGCAGLCILGFCLAAPPPTAGAGGVGGDSGAGAGAGGSNDAQPECGDGEVDGDETCDPPSSCPSSCDDEDSCTVDDSSGDQDTCDFACEHTEITDCEDDDGCCPSDCDANEDSDCSPICGNDAVEPGETCDPPESCASTCDDGQSCTADLSMGSADACTFACAHSPITVCGASEGCCPEGCGPTTDVDCPGCGNGRVEGDLGETCDPPGSCACTDDDVCTQEVTTGSADTCNLVCTHLAITTCTGGDGCCAPGCGPTTDSDCPGCGNGRIELELGETCDPPGTCTCEDHDA